MKKGLFLLSSKTFDINKKSIGINKKICSEANAFLEAGLQCEIINLRPKKDSVFFKLLGFFSKGLYFFDDNKIDGLDYVYVRHIFPTNFSSITILKKIRKQNKNVRIVYEVPTFPYDSEWNGIRGKLLVFIDKLFRKKLRRYVDFVTTYSEDKFIFNIPTIHIYNGINCKEIPINYDKTYSDKEINMIAVAQFANWHGYDRLIEGLRIFYQEKQDKVIKVTFVGEGRELENYKEMIKKYNIPNVRFTGPLSGSDLDDVFKDIDIGIGSLGCHRKGIYYTSELKSREYLARGLLLISSAKVDIIPENFEYCFYCKEDDSPIDVKSICDFYDSINHKYDSNFIRHNIRDFAEKNCDMKKTMKTVSDYFLGK